jgi:hypothetical protein
VAATRETIQAQRVALVMTGRERLTAR